MMPEAIKTPHVWLKMPLGLLYLALVASLMRFRTAPEILSALGGVSGILIQGLVGWEF
jgi:hypothetical protein